MDSAVVNTVRMIHNQKVIVARETAVDHFKSIVAHRAYPMSWALFHLESAAALRYQLSTPESHFITNGSHTMSGQNFKWIQQLLKMWIPVSNETLLSHKSVTFFLGLVKVIVFEVSLMCELVLKRKSNWNKWYIYLHWNILFWSQYFYAQNEYLKNIDTIETDVKTPTDDQNSVWNEQSQKSIILLCWN